MSSTHRIMVRVFAIPDDEDLKFALNFSGQEITELFRIGTRTGQDREAWVTLPAEGLPVYWAPPGMTGEGSGAAGESG